MKVSFKLFLGLTIFYFIMAVIYWQLGGEILGVIALTLSGGLAGLIGFYIWYSMKHQGGILPEDNTEGEIADSAGDLGFYSPHSWWPLPVALSMMAAGLGLIVGWWLTLIGVGALLISVVGFVTEYEKPEVSAH
ncbi:MAG: cytochrome c oxidase subunit 4 [Actinobacteria bacterium]|nr:cytochrome c oxidase subunit 4 [Actinomycetota bacterium]